MGRCAARPPCPLTASFAPERGTTGTRSPGPAARHALSRGLASQRRVPTGRPLTCGVTSWRAMICRIYARYVTPFHAGMPPVSGRGPWRFRPGGAARFPRSAVAFPAGVPWRFGAGCRGVSAGRRARAAAPSRRRSSLRPRRRSPPSACSQAAIHFPGRPSATGRIQHSTPAGGQPLTSGPARVRLTRRMTRRSRSIAVR
jgi:hypothetical protein